MNKIKIYADGNCIVCDTEVAHYKRLAPQLFEIVNIADPEFDAAKVGLSVAAVNKHMHVQTVDGRILIGVDAFAHIWSQLPFYRIAAVIIKLPGIYALAQVAYEIFARNRHLLPKRK